MVGDGVGDGFEGKADGDVIGGHGEREAVGLVACNSGAVRDTITSIAVALSGRGGAVAERQAHLVALSGIEHIVIHDTVDKGVIVAAGPRCLVGRDAADAVGRGHSRVADADVLARRDGVCGLALGVAEGAGVIGVDGRATPVAAEGGAGIVVGRAWQHFRLVALDFGGGIEAVGDVECTVSPPHEAAAVGGGRRIGANYLTIENAAFDIQFAIVAHSHESTMRTVAADRAFDGNAAATVLDGNIAPLTGDKSCSILAGGDDSTIHA